MLLAVAGMKPEQVDATTRRLAEGGASNAERAAYAFVRKQAKDPTSITDADIQELQKHYNPDKAWHVIWWAARCHYMTKVADAFQLPLERNNPFERMPGAKKAKRAKKAE